jgi:hypothetical protein
VKHRDSDRCYAGNAGRVSHTGSNTSQVLKSCLGLSFLQVSTGQIWALCFDSEERALWRWAVSQSHPDGERSHPRIQ